MLTCLSPVVERISCWGFLQWRVIKLQLATVGEESVPYMIPWMPILDLSVAGTSKLCSSWHSNSENLDPHDHVFCYWLPAHFDLMTLSREH